MSLTETVWRSSRLPYQGDRSRNTVDPPGLRLTRFGAMQSGGRAQVRRTEHPLHGAQLDAAMRLIDDNPDFVVVDEVTPFLNAAQRSQKRFWRRVAVGSIATAFALAGLTLAAGLAYRLGGTASCCLLVASTCHWIARGVRNG